MRAMAAALVSALVLIWAARVDAKVETKYTDLAAHVVDSNLAFEVSTDGGEFVSTVCTLQDVENDLCGRPALNFDDDSRLRITFDDPASLPTGTFRTDLMGETYDAPTKVTLKACYSKASITKRKWRNAKNVIVDDKRCGRTIKKNFELSSCTDGKCTVEYDIESDTPSADYFITLYYLCPIKSSDDGETNFCGLDSTVGTLKELMAVKDLQKAGVDEAAREKLFDSELTPRATENYYETEVMFSRPTEMVVGVIVCSIASVTFLTVFYTWERCLKKRQ